MAIAEPYIPDRGLLAKINRRIVQWQVAAPVTIRPNRPMLSITFDDCPKSATRIGGAILDEMNVRACFYVATGLMDTDTVMGRIAGPDDLRAMSDAGHEIGSHTHSHIDCARTNVEDISKSIDQNVEILDGITRGRPIESFAFPFGETTVLVKRRLASRFKTLRGVLKGTNRGVADRAQLRAYEINGCNCSVDRLIEALKTNAASPGWIVMFTHDVADDPSPYGMTPHQLRHVVQTAQALGIEIGTPSQFIRDLGILDK